MKLLPPSYDTVAENGAVEYYSIMTNHKIFRLPEAFR